MSNDLHDEIMNLPAGKKLAEYLSSPNCRLAYKEGHRDARHAAAELAIGYVAAPSAASAAPVEKYGCHIDLADDEEPDNCVLDGGHIDHCVYAMKHGKDARNFCGEWKPVKLVAASSPKCELTDKQIESIYMETQGQTLRTHEVGNVLRFARAIAAASGPNAGLVEALKEFISDITERFDLDSPSTNPGIKFCVEQGRSALAAAGIKEQP